MARETRTFVKEKETKNAIKYAEVEVAGKAPIIGTVYVTKWFAAGADVIEVTVDAAPSVF